MKKSILIGATFVFCAYTHAQETTITFRDIVKLSDNINSEAEEIMPLVSNDGKEMYFVRANHKSNVGGEKTGHDIWVSERKDPQTFASVSNKFKGDLNNIGNNAVVGISKNNDKLFVLNAYKTAPDQHHGIARSMKDGSKWSDPEFIAIPGMNHKSDFFGYYVNPEETVMFISMNSSDAIGKEDIYISTKTGNTWSTPKNLGKNVNSAGFEISPYLSNDGKRLYFSSDGRNGQGSADIYYCERTGDDWMSWSDPVNLGPEVNSGAFDAYFVEGPDGTGYFASNRDALHSDIYAITVEIEEVVVEVVEEPVVEEPVVEEPVVDVPPPPPPPIPSVDNIYFDNNRFFIRQDAKDELDKLAKVMKEMKDLKVEIHGHADHTYLASSNMTLSENRANEAKKYLINKGIDGSRIKTDGFGERKPEVPCSDCTERQLQMNRRVEFKLYR